MRALLRFILRGLTSVMFGIRMKGDVQELKASRLLIIANHESFLDGLLLGLFLPVVPVFVVLTGFA